MDIPDDLFTALEHIFRVIGWMKDLTKEETPPQWMLHLDWELEEWFKKVQIERDRKYGSTSKDDEGGDIYEDDYDENILYERMKRGESLT